MSINEPIDDFDQAAQEWLAEFNRTHPDPAGAHELLAASTQFGKRLRMQTIIAQALAESKTVTIVDPKSDAGYTVLFPKLKGKP